MKPKCIHSIEASKQYFHVVLSTKHCKVFLQMDTTKEYFGTELFIIKYCENVQFENLNLGERVRSYIFCLRLCFTVTNFLTFEVMTVTLTHHKAVISKRCSDFVLLVELFLAT